MPAGPGVLDWKCRTGKGAGGVGDMMDLIQFLDNIRPAYSLSGLEMVVSSLSTAIILYWIWIINKF